MIDAKKMIDAEVAKRSAAELEGAKSRLMAMAGSLGVSISSLFGITPDKKARKKRKETELRIYVNPDKPEQIYKGKGKRPEWLQEKLDAGHDIAEFHMNANRRLDLAGEVH
ncbi:MAG: H-NS histone family protein [Vicinamibacterales bacterium]